MMSIWCQLTASDLLKSRGSDAARKPSRTRQSAGSTEETGAKCAWVVLASIMRARDGWLRSSAVREDHGGDAAFLLAMPVVFLSAHFSPAYRRGQIMMSSRLLLFKLASGF